jgi:NAD(P)H-hydrate epimerase
MENAGFKIAKIAKKIILPNQRVIIFCGKGNNGGDGFVVARHLLNYGIDVLVFKCFDDEKKLTCDSKINYDILLQMNVKISEPKVDLLKDSDLIVDAIFGVGIKGIVSEKYAKYIKMINNSGKKVISIDLPSGMLADTGIILGDCVRADITVTLSLYKKCFFLYPAKELSGKVILADISIPKKAIEDENILISQVDEEKVKGLMPKHAANQNKSDFGKALMICGSEGMSGAAYLSSSAAMRSGSGLVTLCVPKCIASAMEAKTTEVMTVSLPDNNGIILSESYDIILNRAKNTDVILFGCGIGRDQNIDALLEKILCNTDKPIVIDADGLFSLAKNKELVKNKNVVILPHHMEMSRLIGKDIGFVIENSFEVARELSEEYNITVVLKGPNTIICSGGKIYVNTTGSNNLASGGTGDVLAGIIASFIGQGLSVVDASILGVYVHGLCGDILKKDLGYSTIASDLIDILPKALLKLS